MLFYNDSYVHPEADRVYPEPLRALVRAPPHRPLLVSPPPPNAPRYRGSSRNSGNSRGGGAVSQVTVLDGWGACAASPLAGQRLGRWREREGQSEREAFKNKQERGALVRAPPLLVEPPLQDPRPETRKWRRNPNPPSRSHEPWTLDPGP